MGLFWKIFVSIGVAMTVTIVLTVFVSFRLADQGTGSDLSVQTRAQIVEQTAQALATGGEWRLKIWLLQHPRPAAGTVLLVLDEDGNELLGRALPVAMQRLLRTKPFHRYEQPANVRPVQRTPRIIGSDGSEYRLLFVRAPVTLVGILTWPGTRLAVLMIAGAAAALTALLLARYLASPIIGVQKASRALAAGALSTRVGRPFNRRKDEVGRLARDFDAMAEQLQELVTSKEALLRDVSHEFRSPLARIRVALALAERRAGEAAQPDLARIEREVERLNELVGQVMTLARLRSADRVPMEPVGLEEMLGSIISDARFEHPEIDLRLELESVPTLLGDPPRLNSAIENVVRNALTHAGAGTSVKVALSQVADAAVIRVSDHGPGVPERDLERIFEPFFRVDTSRDHRKAGQGIGLAIAARVVALHGGTITAQNRPDGGLSIELRLPVTEETAAAIPETPTTTVA